MHAQRILYNAYLSSHTLSLLEIIRSANVRTPFVAKATANEDGSSLRTIDDDNIPFLAGARRDFASFESSAIGVDFRVLHYKQVRIQSNGWLQIFRDR
jgi:hypothetical protein